ncbi:flagellar biosynthetic protein FliR [Pseudoduganella violacea]|uniref:Flagellar biosynthetic protein FliR n=1 Tax=Pseudoduganella violacea TaxID=1715466 RepID=A0A7W5BEP0_9BURK|nr:flagellar biosynthetic protein FliR [Pseudoduganella violacea]MBB3120840.1 flagellar biosynthetic protein FliR [Pseudoduganella violacea]
MEALLAQLLPWLNALWWPFVRVLAFLSAAPVLGEAMVPVTVRILVSLVLAVVMLPLTQGALSVDPLSLQAVAATLEQAVIGGVLGLAFHFTMSVILLLGFVVSSQMGLSLAVMNDPLNGQSSDVVSSLLLMMTIIIFFSVDGHLVLAGVIGASFQAWPVGAGWPGPLLLQTVAFNVAWIFSAAMLLAIPIVFATVVVQLGFGFLNRVAPTLNLFSLGFAVITMFGLLMLGQVVRSIPNHYVRMANQILDMIQVQMRAAGHG